MRLYFLMIMAFFAVSCQPAETEEVPFQKETVRIIAPAYENPVATLDVEIADTNKKRTRGLMYRTDLADNAGMLFLFPVRRKISMWMANTVIPLDMIFIDKSGTIREIVGNAVPFSHDEIISKDSVSAVLEIKGGQAERLNIRVGDIVEHSFFELEKSR